jgi:hypothetical protein
MVGDQPIQSRLDFLALALTTFDAEHFLTLPPARLEFYLKRAQHLADDFGRLPNNY